MSKIAIIYGKKSEEIRLLPIINELHKKKISILPIQTGEQELQMKDNFVYTNQILAKNNVEQQSKIMQRLNNVLSDEDLSAILVIGNTLSAFCGALYGYLRNVKVLHINAGQRSKNVNMSFPEEGFGRLIDRLSSLYFVSTKFNRKNLIKENVDKDKIYIVGNTLKDIINKLKISNKKSKNEILIAIHKNENSKNIKYICMALNILVKNQRNYLFNVILPSDINMSNELLQCLFINPNINVLKDVPHDEMLEYINNSKLIITDSFGIQEEATILKKPIFILRKDIENKESLKTGAAKLIKAEYFELIEKVEKFLSNKIKFKIKDCKYYGEGSASEKIAGVIEKLYNKL